MRFELIDAAKEEFPVRRLCKVLGVSPSGFFAWKDRPACRRQHRDMVLLAHVRSAFRLSNGTYGSPRMRHELQAEEIAIGSRRVLKSLAVSCVPFAIKKGASSTVGRTADEGETMIRSQDGSKDPDEIGIAALSFLGQDEDLMLRFLDLSGLGVAQLRAEAAKSAFFVALLDFILANESDLLDFAGSIATGPRAIGRARNKLAEKAGISGEDYPA